MLQQTLAAPPPSCGNTRLIRVAHITVTNGGGSAAVTAAGPRSRPPLVTTTRPLADADDGRLWQRAVDLCVVPAEERAHAHCNGGDNNSGNIPVALVMIEVNTPSGRQHADNTSIIGPLSTDYPALTRSLRMLKIVFRGYDESAALGAFAALATQLQELTFWYCGLTSVRGLEGRCEYLRKVDLRDNKQLTSLDGLPHHVYLEEVHASETLITSVEPLRTCPALTKVDLGGCAQLASLEGLEGHQYLQEVDVSFSAIQSVELLRTCPALTRVAFYNCEQLSTIQGLEDHQHLKDMDASFTAIASVEPLRTCPRVTKAELRNCRQLLSLTGLEGHQSLQEVNLSYSRMTSIEPLCSCTALKTVHINGCLQLPTTKEIKKMSPNVNVTGGRDAFCLDGCSCS